MNSNLQSPARSDKPHICFVGPMLGQHPGWVPNPAEHLSPRLLPLGYHSILVSNKINRYDRLLDIIRTLYQRRDQYEVACLQVYSGSSFLVTDLASKISQRLRKPVIMVLHGGDLPGWMTRYPNWARRVLNRAQSLVAPSKFLAQAVAEFGFQARVIPNAINVDDYPFCLRQTARPALLWMRTFHEIYNPLLAVEVLRSLKKSYPQATLTMAGQEKGMLAAVQQRVQSLGLQEAVSFAGFLDLPAKQRVFSDHDIFLNTNHVDNMPISIVEAAATGLTIVATNVGGLPFLLTDGENGLLTPEGDESAFVNAVRRILEEPNLARKLSSNARKLAEQHDWRITLAQWDTLFQEVFPARHSA